MEKLTLEEKSTNYETWQHIHEVQKLLAKVQIDLIQRILEHDQSKLEQPEVSAFTEFTPRLKTVEYGSEEYKKFLTDMKPALDHHYQSNSHHPEHYTNGLEDMNLLDIIEMLCDWKASTLRSKGGDIRKTLQIQKERFGISDQLIKIMENTLSTLEDS